MLNSWNVFHPGGWDRAAVVPVSRARKPCRKSIYSGGSTTESLGYIKGGCTETERERETTKNIQNVKDGKKGARNRRRTFPRVLQRGWQGRAGAGPKYFLPSPVTRAFLRAYFEFFCSSKTVCRPLAQTPNSFQEIILTKLYVTIVNHNSSVVARSSP